ncbi:MAG: hypothetical protein QM800_10565 [Paludibacter sp.]
MMKNKYAVRYITWVIIGVLPIFLFAFKPAASKLKTEKITVDAPFAMPAFSVPDFSKCPVFSIEKYGALQGNKAKTTKAIAKAIAAANAAGGGTVMVPGGEWLTGKVHFKSNVCLQLNKGAVLLFDDVPADYLPAVSTTWEGMECMNYSPLLYAYGCKNIAITGEGKIKAKMDLWKTWAGRPRAHMNSLKRLYNMSYQNVPTAERLMVNDSAHSASAPHSVQSL